MKKTQFDLPYKLDGIPGDLSHGEQVKFSDSEIESFGNYDSFLDGEDLYLGDGKNIYVARKRLMGQNELLLTADCVGVCNPDEYEQIMENENGFDTVVGYVESDFAWYTEEDRFIPSPAESEAQEPSLEFGSNTADEIVRKVLEE